MVSGVLGYTLNNGEKQNTEQLLAWWAPSFLCKEGGKGLWLVGGQCVHSDWRAARPSGLRAIRRKKLEI